MELVARIDFDYPDFPPILHSTLHGVRRSPNMLEAVMFHCSLTFESTAETKICES